MPSRESAATRIRMSSPIACFGQGILSTTTFFTPTWDTAPATTGALPSATLHTRWLTPTSAAGNISYAVFCLKKKTISLIQDLDPVANRGLVVTDFADHIAIAAEILF